MRCMSLLHMRSCLFWRMPQNSDVAPANPRLSMHASARQRSAAVMLPLAGSGLTASPWCRMQGGPRDATPVPSPKVCWLHEADLLGSPAGARLTPPINNARSFSFGALTASAA